VLPAWSRDCGEAVRHGNTAQVQEVQKERAARSRAALFLIPCQVSVGETSTPSQVIRIPRADQYGANSGREVRATAIHVEPELIQRLQAQDDTAFWELYERTVTDVARLVHYLLENPSELEDVVQDIYVAVYRSLPQFDPARPFGPWLTGIVLRQVSAHRRRQWRLGRLKDALVRRAGAQVGGFEPDIAEDVTRSVECEALVQSIRSLPPKLKTVIVLHYLHDYTRGEIAEMLGIPPGTVASRLRLALGILRRKHGHRGSEGGVEEHGF
jgi:RNA polymerase sigma-70 factor (ECF subfamily)